MYPLQRLWSNQNALFSLFILLSNRSESSNSLYFNFILNSVVHIHHLRTHNIRLGAHSVHLPKWYLRSFDGQIKMKLYTLTAARMFKVWEKYIWKPLAAHHVVARRTSHKTQHVCSLGTAFVKRKFIQFLRVQYPTHQQRQEEAAGSFLSKYTIVYPREARSAQCTRWKSKINFRKLLCVRHSNSQCKCGKKNEFWRDSTDVVRSRWVNNTCGSRPTKLFSTLTLRKPFTFRFE